jgi:hypothetical protein
VPLVVEDEDNEVVLQKPKQHQLQRHTLTALPMFIQTTVMETPNGTMYLDLKVPVLWEMKL